VVVHRVTGVSMKTSGRPASSIVMPSRVATTRSAGTGTSVPYERSISAAP
jgi:hypothetical protein